MYTLCWAIDVIQFINYSVIKKYKGEPSLKIAAIYLEMNAYKHVSMSDIY